MKSLILKIVTPERMVSEETVMRVTLPVQDGEVTLLPDHSPYIGALKSGEIRVFHDEKSNETTSLAVSGGFVEFHDNVLILLANTAEHAHEIDMARAKEAIDRAKDLMTKTAHEGSEEYARTAASLEKQLTRLHVARKHHTRHGFSGEMPSSF